MSEPLNLRKIERQAQAEAQGRYRLGRESTGAEICLVPNPLAADVLTLVALVREAWPWIHAATSNTNDEEELHEMLSWLANVKESE